MQVFEQQYKERQAKAHKEWILDHYRKAKAAAAKVVDDNNEGLIKLLNSKPADQVTQFLTEECDEDDVPGLFWYGFAWAASMNLQREEGAKALKFVPTVKALMQWVVKTRPRYFNGGAHLVLAIFELSLGKSIGGKPEEGLKHLEAVDQMNGGRLLLPKVLKAEFYLPQIQTLASTPTKKVTEKERKAHAVKVWQEYLRILEDVMSFPFSSPAKFNLRNAVAKLRAENLYYRADDILFQPEGTRLPEREDEDSDDEEDDDEEDEDDE